MKRDHSNIFCDKFHKYTYQHVAQDGCSRFVSNLSIEKISRVSITTTTQGVLSTEGTVIDVRCDSIMQQYTYRNVSENEEAVQKQGNSWCISLNWEC